MILDELGVKRTLNINPLFQALFNFLTFSNQEIILPDLTMTPLSSAGNMTMVDITLTVNDFNDSLHCIFQYNPDLFRRETIERFSGHFLSILNAIAVDDESSWYAKIPLLTTEETEMILNRMERLQQRITPGINVFTT